MGTGYNTSTGGKSDFYEWNPSTDQWTTKANFAGGIRYNAVGFAVGTKGYVGTGYATPTYYNDLWEYNTPVSIQENQYNFDIPIYPNPMKDFAVIETGKGNITRLVVEIYDVQGKKIAIQSINTDQKLYRGNLPEGIYIVKWLDENKVLAQSKLVVVN